MRQKYKETPLLKNQQSNPFSKSNPYRIKAKFYSSQKSQTKNSMHYSIKGTSLSTNPQSLLYKRNYKQSPAIYQNNNFVGSGSIYENQKYMGHDYKLKLKKHIAQQFCPSDPYLQVVKNRFAFFSGQRDSQFRNVMKMSNLGISKFQVRSKYNSQNKGVSYSQGGKENPFYRKNLVESTQRSSNEFDYSSIMYISNNYLTVSNVNTNNNGINQSYISNGQYEYPVTKNGRKQSILSKKSSGLNDNGHNGIINTIIYGGQSLQKTGQPNYSPRSNQSFGIGGGRESIGWKQQRKINEFIDCVIQNAVDDKDGIQQKGVKQIKVNGKSFFLQQVRRTRT